MKNPNTSTFASSRASMLARLACCALCCLPMPANAGGNDPQLLAAVEAFLLDLVRQADEAVSITLLPASAQLPVCENPEPFLPQPASGRWGRISVGVHCGTSTRSTRYMQAQVSVTGTYFTASRRIPAGTMVTAALLEATRGDTSQLPPHAILDADEAIGLLTKHQLAPGTIVQSQHLYRLPLVQPSQKVSIETRGAGFTVSSTGEALDAGALGDRIRVRTGRQRTLSVVVTGAGRASPAP